VTTKLGHITTFGGNAVIASAAPSDLQEITNIINEDALTKEAVHRRHLTHPYD
jgi:acetylornithine aminotransferase